MLIINGFVSGTIYALFCSCPAIPPDTGDTKMYGHRDNQVVFLDHEGNAEFVRAVCAVAPQAAEMLNRAGYLNDVKRKYTAAARLIAQVEALPDFHWID